MLNRFNIIKLKSLILEDKQFSIIYPWSSAAAGFLVCTRDTLRKSLNDDDIEATLNGQ